MLIDTHCHLNLMVKQEDQTSLSDILTQDLPLTQTQLKKTEQIIQEAACANVTKIISIGTSLNQSLSNVQLAKQYKNTFATVGIHPGDCTKNWRQEIQEIKKIIVENKQQSTIVGVGETGLDFYWPNFDKQRQRDAFKAHIELALENDLALVIHLRQATNEHVVGFAQEELFEQLSPYKNQITRGVMHCFSHDKTFATTMIEWGFALGIGGVITYPKNAELRETVRQIPLEKLVLETDAPFLPPQIARGKQNHPKYIAVIAQFLADLKNSPLEEVAQKTSGAAQRIFQI